jgi:hypothetical protein
MTMKKLIVIFAILGFIVFLFNIDPNKVSREEKTTPSPFYLHIDQSRSEVVAAINEPNYSDMTVDRINGKIERCQWGSERAGAMVVIWFKEGKVLRFETKGKVN